MFLKAHHTYVYNKGGNIHGRSTKIIFYFIQFPWHKDVCEKQKFQLGSFKVYLEIPIIHV